MVIIVIKVGYKLKIAKSQCLQLLEELRYLHTQAFLYSTENLETKAHW